jgi:pyrophosphatase PpaX
VKPRVSSEPADVRLARSEAVFFDFDGTLIDTCELIATSFRHAVAAVLGEKLAEEDLTRNVGAPLRQQMEELAPGRGEELVAVYREFNHAKHDEIARPFSGIEQVLAELSRRGTPMAVVTSKGRAAVELGIQMIGLDRYIDVIVTADDVEIHKPDPHPLRVTAERMAVDIERVAYVGDSPHDIASANAAGAVSVAALWGMFGRERLAAAGPDYVLTEPLDVLDLLEGRIEPFEDDERAR